MTLQEFAPIFAMLAVQLRAADADEATVRAYYEPLKELEVEFVRAAASRLAAQTDVDGQSWFPRSGEWRAAASAAEGRAREAQQAFIRKLPAPLCQTCGDTAWHIGADNRARRCDCQRLRRLELLGRRPWPAIGPAPEAIPRELPPVVQAAVLAEARPRSSKVRQFSKMVEP